MRRGRRPRRLDGVAPTGQALYDIADGLCESDELDGDTIKVDRRDVHRHHRAPRPDPHQPPAPAA